MNLVQISLHIMINWTALFLSQTIYFNFHIANFLTPCVFWELRRQCKNWKKTIIFQKSHPFPYFYSNESKRNRETTQCLLSSSVSRTKQNIRNFKLCDFTKLKLWTNQFWKFRSKNFVILYKNLHSYNFCSIKKFMKSEYKSS